MKKDSREGKGRLWIMLIVAVAGIAGGVILIASGHTEATDTELAFRTYTVEKVDYRETVEVSGNTEPLDSADLSFPVSGQIAVVAVEEGQTVTPGQLLAQLEDSAERYNLAAVELSLQEKRLSGTARELKLLELEREVKTAALEDTRLASPIDGVISEVLVGVGDYVGPGSEIIRVIDSSAMTAAVELDELDVPLVGAGQHVQFFFDAFPNLEVNGYLAPLPEEGRVTDQGLAVLDVTLVIDDPPAELRPGFSFTAEIVVSEIEGILVVDDSAVLDRNGKTVVLLPSGTEEERPTPRLVQVDSLGDGRYQILSGLEEGDTVVVAVASATAGGKDSGSTNPLSVLGFPEGGPRMGGGPPGGGDGGGR